MKIVEITDKNRSWQILHDFDLDFDTPYQNTVRFVEAILQSGHKSKYNSAKQYTAEFINIANDFLNAKPFDPNDSDIITLQNQVRMMVLHLEELLEQFK